jgi:tRNA pseudouridine38-40 synthase
MAEAAALLEGTHDFSSFQASGGDQMTTVRTIYRCSVERRGDMGYDIVVEGDGFLYKMVRILAGTLVMVGMGLVPPEAVLLALAKGEHSPGLAPGAAAMTGRGLTGPALPPEYLCLEYIEYDFNHEKIIIEN